MNKYVSNFSYFKTKVVVIILSLFHVRFFFSNFVLTVGGTSLLESDLFYQIRDLASSCG